MSGQVYLCSLSTAVMTKTVTNASSPPKVNPSYVHFTERASHSVIQRSASETQTLFENGVKRTWIHGEGELYVYTQYKPLFRVIQQI